MADDQPTALLRRIKDQRKENDAYRALIDGTTAVAEVNRKDARAREFKKLLEWGRIDIANVVVETTAERLTVEGFRTDPKSLEGDDEAWELWSRVGGPLTSQLTIIDALSVGDSFLLVEKDEDGQAIVTGESSDSMTVVYKPGSRSEIVMAAKAWAGVDLNGEAATYLTVFDSETVSRYVARGDFDAPTTTFALLGSEPNRLGFVPVQHVRNRPSLRDNYGRSELFGLENDLGRLNKLCTDLLMLSEFSSFKVRYATGIETETTPDGEPIKPFNIGPDRLLTSPNDDARFGTLDESSLDPIIAAVKLAVSQVAALSRTPMFYLTGDLVNVGEGGLRAMDMQLVAKVKQRQLEMQTALAETMRMALRVEGNPLADGPIEVMWTDPVQRGFSDLANGVTQLYGVEAIPLEQAWIELGYGPLERERMRGYAAQDAARRRLESMGVTQQTVARLRSVGGSTA